METDINQQDINRDCKDWHEYRHPRAGRVLGGLVLISVGVVWFMHKMGYFFPAWLFTWKMGLIVLGLYIGAKHLFRGAGWLAPILIGGLFLMDDLIPGFHIRPFVWPIVVVMMGLFMIFRPRRCGPHRAWHRRWKHRERRYYRDQYRQQERDRSTEDRIDTVVVFGSTRKNIISKDFKGGEVTCVFGGAEINLGQADINGTVILEMHQVFGGTKLIVPPHWRVNYSETVAFLGGIEDKRGDNLHPDSDKVLTLKGTSVLGGIQISSY
ncbi:MAG: hypothetical protein H6585_09425 [Flavobacteriales bacterium]|nr:hypothetical protein [Flavobacteriales bacterium]MCB9448549.1 hypothetical protein [Flavobacteriales bacterium]